MPDLSNSIYTYYLANFDQLSLEKRFHFASRLYLWSHDQNCLEKLHALRSWFTYDGQPVAAVAAASRTPSMPSTNAGVLRQRYFDKYPKLQSYNNTLFRINFLQTIYGIDVRSTFIEHFGHDEPEALIQALKDDPEAVRILSTNAINFFYLYTALVSQKPEAIDPESYFKIAQSGYDLSDLVHLQLKIYLLTHCIIGATQFYYHQIPAPHLATYRRMVDELETLIEHHTGDVNLDNKFEFLVCCKLLARPSRLEERIFEEAKQSISPEGTFLIDTYNNNPQREKVDLTTSEHRNVLFLMASRDYKPIA